MLALQRTTLWYVVVLQSTGDVGAGGAGVGGSAATGNVNGYKNLGSLGGNGAGGTGVDNSKTGRHLLGRGGYNAVNKQVCYPHDVLMQHCYLSVPLWRDGNLDQEIP